VTALYVPAEGPLVPGDGGVEIATWHLGGTGPPLLLLHATGFHAFCWVPLAPVLGRHFEVWAVDQRGHGASGHSPSGSYGDWHSFVADILAVVDALELESPVAAGHSLGGAVLLLAEQRRPATFASLYCYEPIVIPSRYRFETAGGGGKTGLSSLTRKRRAVFASRQEALANYRSKPPFSTFAPEVLEAYVDHGFETRADGSLELRLSPSEESTIYEGAADHDAYEHLPELRLPVTIAGGSDGGDLGLSLVRDLSERIPGGRFEHHPNLSHFGPMEDPAGVAGAITSALMAAGSTDHVSGPG
jgi:pimeloyl-ACP methyl ester carboxylesterase